MKYIIELKNGMTQANISVNGVALLLKDGQEVSEIIAKAIPNFVREESEEIKEIKEIKEELLTEISEPLDIIVEEVEEVKTEAKPKKSRKSKK